MAEWTTIRFLAAIYMAMFQDAGLLTHWHASHFTLAVMKYQPHEATYWRPRGQHDACSFAAFYRMRDAWEDKYGRMPNECRDMIWDIRIGTRYHADLTTLGLYNVQTHDLSVHVTEYARLGPYGTMAHEMGHVFEACATNATNRVQRDHLTEGIWKRHSGQESLEWQVQYGFPLIDISECAPVYAPEDKQGTYIGPAPR